MRSDLTALRPESAVALAEKALPAPVTARFTVGGIGTALPRRVVTNDDIAQYLDTNDEWIRARTGIRERRIVGPDETTRTLGTAAARQALDAARLAPEDLDTIIVATATPDHPMPSTASEIATDLGSRPGTSNRVTAGAFDINAACAGFVYALTVAGSLLETGAARRVLLVGADTMSRVVDQQDRSSAVLFGDGAAALVLQRPDQGRSAGTSSAESATPPAQGGIIACDLVDDPDAVDLLVIPGGGSAEPATFDSVNDGRHFLRMDGNEVFRRAVRGVAESVERTLSQAGVRAEDVDLFVPHQANARIIDAVLPRIGIEQAQTVQTVDHHGNTSAASIPLALAEAAAAGRLADGHLVLTSGFGAGLTIGTALLRWRT